jgi:hypothetical protein
LGRWSTTRLTHSSGAAVSRLAPVNPTHSHPGARIWVAGWLQRADSGVFRRARRARFPCKSLVDRIGLEPVTSAVQTPLATSHVSYDSHKKSAICRGSLRQLSRAVPTRVNESRAFGLQNGCRRHRGRDPRQPARDTLEVPRSLVVHAIPYMGHTTGAAS